MAARAAGSETCSPFAVADTPVSSNHGCDESRQTPIRIKQATMILPVALAASPPQKNVGATTCPMGSSQTHGFWFSGTNPSLARVAGDPL